MNGFRIFFPVAVEGRDIKGAVVSPDLEVDVFEDFEGKTRATLMKDKARLYTTIYRREQLDDDEKDDSLIPPDRVASMIYIEVRANNASLDLAMRLAYHLTTKYRGAICWDDYEDQEARYMALAAAHQL